MSEWAALGLELPDRDAIRRYRLQRVRAELAKHDYAGIVLHDPMNVRYATDSTNMQVWVLHNANRYCFVPSEGPVVMFEVSSTTGFLNDPFELIDEVRPATSWFYFAAGPTFSEKAQQWAAEIAALVAEHGGGNKRLAPIVSTQRGSSLWGNSASASTTGRRSWNWPGSSRTLKR